MSRTTQRERDTYRDFADKSGGDFSDIIHDLCRDADRLSRLEYGIRALADKYHNADAKQPGAVVRADTFESELRGLLDD